MKNTLTLFLVLFCFGQSNAQLCKKTSLFFEAGESKLSIDSKKSLDSLINVIEEDEYLIEIYGMTDSVGSGKYNSELAERRMSSAERYLKLEAKGSLTFKKKNLIEANAVVSTSEGVNLAYNRRVDIYLIPIANGRIQISGNGGLNVEYPLGFFEPCGVCNSAPSLRLYTDNAESAAQGITFMSTDGDSLITAGSIALFEKPCGENNTDTAEVIYRVCDNEPDTNMTVWEADTIQGKVYWRETSIPLAIDPITGCYIFKGKGRPFRNLDKKRKPPPRIKLTPDTIYRVLLPQGISYGNVYITDAAGSVRYNARPDSIQFEPKDSALFVRMFVQYGNEYYHKTIRIQDLRSEYRKGLSKVIRVYHPGIESFQPLFPRDTTQLVKNGKPQTGKFGYYLPEYNMYIPIDSVEGRYYVGGIPGVTYQYAFRRGKKLYVYPEQAQKGKYSSRKNSWKFRVKKKMLGKFKLVKSHFIPAVSKKK